VPDVEEFTAKLREAAKATTALAVTPPT
jgi:hypothetical protein